MSQKNITQPRSSINSKYEELKQICTWTNHDQTVQRKKINLINSKKKATYVIQRIINEITSNCSKEMIKDRRQWNSLQSTENKAIKKQNDKKKKKRIQIKGKNKIIQIHR